MDIKATVLTHRLKLGFILLLILAEAGLNLLFPLFIGYAIDDAIAKSYEGAAMLGGLGFALILIAGGRRFFDSRVYAGIFKKLSIELQEFQKESSASTRSARLNMLNELVEFMEYEVPQLVNNSIGLVGTLIILIGLNINIFYLSLGVFVVVITLYLIVSRKTIRLNREYNDVLEEQVEAISNADPKELKEHVAQLMKWNVALSDHETKNYSLSWVFLIAALVGAIVIAVGEGDVSYGAVFAIIMYFFQYMENVLGMPLFYQQWLRLVEIVDRLSSDPKTA